MIKLILTLLVILIIISMAFGVIMYRVHRGLPVDIVKYENITCVFYGARSVSCWEKCNE